MGLGEVREMASDGVAIHAEDANCVTSAKANLSPMMGPAAEFGAAETTLHGGESFKIGEMSVRVVHTPGHTRGGCCFIVSEGGDSLVLSGDTLFARSVGRTDLPGGSDEALSASLSKLDSLGLSDDTPVYPGHGPETTLGEERRLNPFWPR
jgi:glyoxylase-like metal-dependent hydrolase (beta-lactamase superfamily II)